jgi:hypothetical protein
MEQASAMNMITALLGATGLLLVVAVVLSVMKMSNASEEAELKELRAELAALNDQQSRLNPPAPAPPLDPGPTASAPITPIPAPISPSSPNPGNGVAVPPAAPTLPSTVSEDPVPGEGVVTRTQLEAELAKAERENELLKEEAKQGLISKPMIEAAKKQKARASTVRQAWLQAKVVEWVDKQPDQQAGGFAIIELHREIQPGTILAIRRQAGIYGQLKVAHIFEPEKTKASANPVRGTFPDGAPPVIKPGDELILPPFGN